MERFADRMSSISAAQPGWNVVFLRSKAPWVDIRPIACWGLVALGDDGVGYVVPMIRGKTEVYLIQPDPERHWKIAQPDENIEHFVEMAKAYRREQSRMARKARKERERKAREADTGEGSTPVKPARAKTRRTPRVRLHRKLKTVHGSLMWRFTWEPEEQAGKDVLLHFLSRACQIGRDHEGSATALYEHYCLWCKTFGIAPVRRARVSNLFKNDLGATGTKRGGRIDHWKGIGVDTSIVPELAPVDKTPEGRSEMRREFYRFVKEQVVLNTRGYETLDSAYGCYQAWCRRNGIHPLSEKVFARELNGVSRRSGEGGGGDENTWRNIKYKWPV